RSRRAVSIAVRGCVNRTSSGHNERGTAEFGGAKACKTRGLVVKKQFLIGLCKYGLGIGLLAYVVWKNWLPAADGSSPGLAAMLQRPLQVVPLACASLLCLIAILLTFYRWYLLVRAQNLPCTLMNALRLGLIGFFFSNFLPSSVG